MDSPLRFYRQITVFSLCSLDQMAVDVPVQSSLCDGIGCARLICNGAIHTDDSNVIMAEMGVVPTRGVPLKSALRHDESDSDSDLEILNDRGHDVGDDSDSDSDIEILYEATGIL